MHTKCNNVLCVKQSLSLDLTRQLYWEKFWHRQPRASLCVLHTSLPMQRQSEQTCVEHRCADVVETCRWLVVLCKFSQQQQHFTVFAHKQFSKLCRCHRFSDIRSQDVLTCVNSAAEWNLPIFSPVITITFFTFNTKIDEHVSKTWCVCILIHFSCFHIYLFISYIINSVTECLWFIDFAEDFFSGVLGNFTLTYCLS